MPACGGRISRAARGIGSSLIKLKEIFQQMLGPRCAGREVGCPPAAGGSAALRAATFRPRFAGRAIKISKKFFNQNLKKLFKTF